MWVYDEREDSKVNEIKTDQEMGRRLRQIVTDVEQSIRQSVGIDGRRHEWQVGTKGAYKEENEKRIKG